MKGDYIGDYERDYYRSYEADTRSFHYRSRGLYP